MNKLRTLRRIILFGFVIIVLSFIFLRYFFYEVPILMYHSVAPSCPENSLLCVSQQSFERQMDFISSRRYRVISLEELVDALSRKESLPRNTAVITFDDGAEDIYQYAFSILKKYGLQATVFVITDSAGKRGFLSWEQLRQIQSHGIDIGSHTQTHAYLPGIGEEQLWKEISVSKKEIEGRLGKKISLFSYPTGGYSPEIVSLVKKAGYKGACTTNRGRYCFNPDLYTLRRIKMSEDSDNPLVMWVKLSGIYNLFRKK